MCGSPRDDRRHGGHQALDAELSNLRLVDGPPEGVTLLTVRAGQVTGAIACRDLHGGSCEMKRRYVPERFRGQGTGLSAVPGHRAGRRRPTR